MCVSCRAPASISDRSDRDLLDFDHIGGSTSSGKSRAGRYSARPSRAAASPGRERPPREIAARRDVRSRLAVSSSRRGRGQVPDVTIEPDISSVLRRGGSSRLAAVAVPAAIALGAAALLAQRPDRHAGVLAGGPGLPDVLEAAYLVAAASVLVGIPRWPCSPSAGGGRARDARSSPARGSSVASLAISLMLAESVAAVWLRSHAALDRRAGGRLGPAVARRSAGMWPPLGLDDVALPTRFPDPPGDARYRPGRRGRIERRGRPLQRRGSRSAGSSPGSSRRPSRGDASASRSWPARATRSSSSISGSRGSTAVPT